MLYIFKKNKNNKKGSVLIFSLFIMMISLAAGIGIISVANFDKQSSFATVRTVSSFQVADAGLERSLFAIKYEASTTIINNIPFFSTCSSGETIKSAYAGNYTITFYDNGSLPSKLSCSDTVGDIKTIKSIGEYQGVSRAVMVTLPAP